MMRFRTGILRIGRGVLTAALLIGVTTGSIFAEEQKGINDELKEMKERLEVLEKAQQVTTDGAGHKLHPVHSVFGIKISGGLTGIYQGSLGNRKEFGGNRAEGQMSADLFLESPIGDKGSFLLRLDIEQGLGLTRFPPVFTNPDGNLTGPNNDIETFNNMESLNVNEVRYEHRLFGDSLKVTLGQIDLTSYFDENNYANKETFQYIAQHFNNNIAIDWGGSVNFFGPGFILTAYPTEALVVTLGWFEGNGNYERFFDEPFLAGQLALKTDWAGREGNYRFYGWGRQTPHCKRGSDPAAFLNCDLINPADRVQIKGSNSGVGLSMDQQLSESVGFWARLGFQDPDVSQFDKAFSTGVVTSGSVIGRQDDILGLAYGIVLPSGSYKGATGNSDKEHYAEIYYKYVVSGDGSTTGFHLTPDVQLVANPAGNGAVDPVVVYGLRAQVHF